MVRKSSVLDRDCPIVAKSVVSAVTLEDLAADHPRDQPVYICWFEERRRQPAQHTDGRTVMTDFTAFYMKVATILEDEDHIIVMPLGFYPLTAEGSPDDPEYARLITAGAREVYDVAWVYLELCGLTVKRRILLTLDGLGIPEGKMEFLHFDPATRSFQYPAVLRPGVKKRQREAARKDNALKDAAIAHSR